MPQTQKTTTKNEKATNGQKTTDVRKPADQALQVVDVAVGTPPTVAETVRTTAETWTNSETRSKEIETLQTRVKTLRDSEGRKSEIESLRKRLAEEVEKAEAKGGDVRRQVTDQLIGQARKARDRVEPVYRDRFEPIVKERFEPVYRERVEPAVNRVRERI
jgi:regulator of replication initiation timing